MKIFLVIILLFSSGCATSGYQIDTGTQNLTTDNVNKIVKGKTTQDEIIAMLGQPMIKNQAGVLGTMWTYSRSTQTNPGMGFFDLSGPKQELSSVGLTITFDENNIVKDYSYIESNPMMNVSIKKL